MACDRILKGDERIEILALRDLFAFARRMAEEGVLHAPRSLTDKIAAVKYALPGGEGYMNQEYEVGRKVNEIRNLTPGFLYVYRRYECHRDLLMPDCPIVNEDPQIPYLIMERLEDPILIEDLAQLELSDRDVLSILFQISYAVDTLYRKMNLSYTDLPDILVEKLEEPRAIRLGENLYLKTFFRIGMGDYTLLETTSSFTFPFLDLAERVESQAFEEVASMPEEDVLSSLYQSCLDARILFRDVIPEGMSVYESGPCFTTDEIQTRYLRNPEVEYRRLVDFLVSKPSETIYTEYRDKVVHREMESIRHMMAGVKRTDSVTRRQYLKERIHDKKVAAEEIATMYGDEEPLRMISSHLGEEIDVSRK